MPNSSSGSNASNTGEQNQLKILITGNDTLTLNGRKAQKAKLDVQGENLDKELICMVESTGKITPTIKPKLFNLSIQRLNQELTILIKKHDVRKLKKKKEKQTININVDCGDEIKDDFELMVKSN